MVTIEIESESLLMCLLLSQQKMIDLLSAQVHDKHKALKSIILE
jgi:hypothetical protein